MMNSYNLFNQFEQKPYKGFKNLAVGNYEIKRFRLVKNKFLKEEDSPKRVLLVELEDQILYLPAYFAVNFEDDDRKVDAVNKDGVRRFLCFKGANANS